MKVLFIVRSTLFSVRGGDTVQVEETAAHLRLLGVEVSIRKSSEHIDYSGYRLIHFLISYARPTCWCISVNQRNHLW